MRGVSQCVIFHLPSSVLTLTIGFSSEYGQHGHPGLHPHEPLSVLAAQQGASNRASTCPATPGEPHTLCHHSWQRQWTFPAAGTPRWKECAPAGQEAASTGILPARDCQPAAVWAPETTPAWEAARQWLPTRGNRRRPAHQAQHPPALSSECAHNPVRDWFLKPLSFNLPFRPITPPILFPPCRIIPTSKGSSRAMKDWVNQPNSFTTLLLFLFLYVHVSSCGGGREVP